jgi:hypothetical protein
MRFKELVKRHHPDANGGDRMLTKSRRDAIKFALRRWFWPYRDA